MDKPDYIIVIGTSAGGLTALAELVSYFKPDMNAAVLIVIHLAASSVSDFLLLKLQPKTALKVSIAAEGNPIVKGTIYIAPANHHLMVDDGQVLLGRGPKENRWKPSIDVLFRSAAATWTNRVTGVILTGLLDDGTVGMTAVKKSGGTCIVQDPNEAEYPDMPVSVLSVLQPDQCLPLSKIGTYLNDHVAAAPPAQLPAPAEICEENSIASKVAIGYEAVENLGHKSKYACPDCGGGLYAIKDQPGMERYRCYIGHAYSEKELSFKQEETLESTLWVALRLMEERKTLLNKMEQQNAARGFVNVASGYYQKALKIDLHISQLKNLLFEMQETKDRDN